MVRNDRPAPKPVPPQNVRHAVDGQIHLQQKIKEHQAVLQRNAQIAKPGKPVIDLKHQQEAVRLREKFKQAAAKERDQGR